MSLRGQIVVDVTFADTASATGVDTTKALSLITRDEYDSGKVAIISGTVGTGTVTISFTSPGYTAASGSAVSFANVSRLAFSAGSTTLVRCTGFATGKPAILSRADQGSVSEVGSTETAVQIAVDAASGTSSYTLVLYGS